MLPFQVVSIADRNSSAHGVGVAESRNGAKASTTLLTRATGKNRFHIVPVKTLSQMEPQSMQELLPMEKRKARKLL